MVTSLYSSISFIAASRVWHLPQASIRGSQNVVYFAIPARLLFLKHTTVEAATAPPTQAHRNSINRQHKLAVKHKQQTNVCTETFGFMQMSRRCEPLFEVQATTNGVVFFLVGAPATSEVQTPSDRTQGRTQLSQHGESLESRTTESTRWCKQAALRSSCATLRE